MLNWFFGTRTLDQHIQAGNFEQALALLDSALEVQPADPELLEGRAQMLARLGRAADR
ncbi:MAG: tetratricopeptide repeat protein [Gammaproteobacteria bacterium]|nr:tetratricopeptide repeat protein [Gammaproteobacteria bacterium]